MDITSILAPEHIELHAEKRDKSALLRHLAARIADAASTDPDALATALLKRENLGSTGVGRGIAIPHARIPGIAKPVGALAILERPIDFDAVDERPVDIVFLLAMPDSDVALGTLASVSRLLRQEDTARSLRGARSAHSVHAILAGGTSAA